MRVRWRGSREKKPRSDQPPLDEAEGELVVEMLGEGDGVGVGLEELRKNTRNTSTASTANRTTVRTIRCLC
jgi:hypothetical protein